MKQNVDAIEMLNELYDRIGQFLQEMDNMKKSSKTIQNEIAEEIREFVDMLTDERNWEDDDDRKDFYSNVLYEAIGKFMMIEAAERYERLTGYKLPSKVNL